jgi:sugar/nucleoside kinase (ribokinase family)
MPAVLCVGIATLDHVFAVATLPTKPEKHRAHDLAVVGGGIAANAAVAVARLGGRAALATRLGADGTAEIILDELAREGVTTLRVAVRSDESPEALLHRADVVVDGPSGVVKFLAELTRSAEINRAE